MEAAFRIYRILCSTPPDLDPDREVFESTLRDFGEAVTFPHRVLFAGASFNRMFDAVRNRPGAEANVRMCEFFVHMFGETWPAAPFEGFVDLARGAAADPSLPMRQALVLFRNFDAADEKVRECRARLETAGDCVLEDYGEPGELAALLGETYARWWEMVQTAP